MPIAFAQQLWATAGIGQLCRCKDEWKGSSVITIHQRLLRVLIVPAVMVLAGMLFYAVGAPQAPVRVRQIRTWLAHLARLLSEGVVVVNLA